MKLALVGKDQKKVDSLICKVKELGYIISNEPDVVLSIGGDGSFLIAERKFPGVPKIAVRHKESLCRLCHAENFEDALKIIYNKKYNIVEYNKIEAKINGKKLVASNEIVVRNKELYHAIRFDLKINGKEFHDLIGDGIVVATAYGSTGYFYSITKKSFESGFGLAFNNLSTKNEHIILNEPVIEMTLKRNTAQISSDNDPCIIEAKEGDSIIFNKSESILRVIKL